MSTGGLDAGGPDGDTKARGLDAGGLDRGPDGDTEARGLDAGGLDGGPDGDTEGGAAAPRLAKSRLLAAQLWSVLWPRLDTLFHALHCKHL